MWELVKMGFIIIILNLKLYKSHKSQKKIINPSFSWKYKVEKIIFKISQAFDEGPAFIKSTRHEPCFWFQDVKKKNHIA